MNSMRFSDTSTSRTYSDRTVDKSWLDWCTTVIDPAGKRVVDIGCGGGIYCHGFALAGARQVTGIDSSDQYIKEAKESYPDLAFIAAPCDDTGFDNESADIIFERALIHHLDQDCMTSNANEMYRILTDKGVAVIQDRTIDDVLARDEDYWIRRELITMYPGLIGYEKRRRPESSAYTTILTNAGFDEVTLISFPEVRKVYDTIQELVSELKLRKGKSILYQLSDDELSRYCDRLVKISPGKNLVERDRWTIWIAKKQRSSR